MDLSKIKAGDIVPNYPKMCELLEVKERSQGNSRTGQQKDWERYFDYKKQGHKFIINEIYKQVKPKNDGRSKGNNSSYVTHASLILLSHLIECFDDAKEDYVYIYNREIRTIIGLCNNYFIDGIDAEELDEIHEENSIKKRDITNFYKRSNIKINEVIKSTIKHINRNYDFIAIEDKYLITDRGTTVKREATSEEEAIIKDTRDALLKQMGVKNEFTIYARRKQNEFYRLLDELLSSEYSFAIAYRVNRVSFNKDINVISGTYHLTEDATTEYVNIVNKELHNYLDKQAEDGMTKYKEDKKAEAENRRSITKAKIIDDTPKRRFSVSMKDIPDTAVLPYGKHDKYVENQKYLSNLLIKVE